MNSRHGPIEGSPETSSFYRLAFECANEGIWLVDGEWKTTLVNPRMCQMLGYSEEEMHGRNPSDFFMDSEKARHWDEAVARRQQGVKEDYDFLFRCKDGSELRVMVSAAPLIDASGTFAGSVAVMTDLTQRHAFEQRSRAEDRLDVTATMQIGRAHV